MTDDAARARRILADAASLVAFTGAGLSAESGVSTFRDAATGGHWLKHDPMRLASQDGFADDPDLVIRWYNDRRRTVAAAEPNPAHLALATRTDLVNVTQNVDDLLKRAGAREVVHVHGVLSRDRCNASCGYEAPVDLANPPDLRACPACGDRLRPGVVWFGEALPPDAWEHAASSCTACDAMLVVGTAAEVYPAAGLIEVARSAGARIVVVNTQASGAGAGADIEVIGKAGAVVPGLLQK